MTLFFLCLLCYQMSSHQLQSDMYHHSTFIILSVFFHIFRLTLNSEHSHCNVMARMGTILILFLFFHDFIANFPHIMTIFLVMVKGSHSLFSIYLRKEDSWSHFVTTWRNLTGCPIKVPPISFLGQNSHGIRNTATCLAPLTKVVASLLSFTNI